MLSPRAHRIGTRIRFALPPVLIALAAQYAGALIINGGLSAMPSESYIGRLKGGTAVPIGPRTVLTAAHVGADVGDKFWLEGKGYRAVEAITSPTSDLMRITLDRDLPGWYPLAAEPLKKGAKLTIAGWGLTGQLAKGGYEWIDDREQVWGYNRLDSLNDGHLWFRFDKKGGSQEAVLTPGDSGGAVFITGPDGRLQLAGINRAVYLKSSGRASFGDTSIAVNLLAERSFLAGIPTFLPTPGTASLAFAAALFATRRRR